MLWMPSTHKRKRGGATNRMNLRFSAHDPGFEARLTGLRAGVERHLDAVTPGEASPQNLADAMRYCLLAPAKRARALLTILSAVHCGAGEDDALNAASALEMVHASSLILDDLPAMDDAALRRGRETCHRVYGEATAVLAAIALMNRAFGLVAEDEELPPDRRVQVIAILARSIGTDGLTGGQEGDLHGVGITGAAGVEWIHARKTGALFAAATEIGAVVAGSSEHRTAMHAFGMNLGLAFQAYDDLLDARAASASVGKDTGRDGSKATLVKLEGFDAALSQADRQMQEALRCAPNLATGEGLLARYVTGLTAMMRGQLEVPAAPVSHA